MQEKEEILKSVGEKLKQIRESKNLSQSMLANDVNIPKNQIGRIERAEISTTLTTLNKICKVLGVKVKDLIDF